MLEVARDRVALAWNFLVAPLFVIGMAAVFTGGSQTVMKVGVLSEVSSASGYEFLKTPAVSFYDESNEEEGITKVQRQSVDLLLDLRGSTVRYWMNEDSQKSQLLQQTLLASDPMAVAQPVTGERVSYADWLVPGLLALNIMFSSMFAIGHVIVGYRKSGFLKRLNGTPLQSVEFISAQLIATLLMLVSVTSGIFLVCTWLLDLHVVGSYFNLLLVTVIGAMSMVTMSMLVSARVSSEEVSGGLLNLIAWPMAVLSGVFFSLDGAPDWVQSIASLFPLTHMLDAARAVMLDGAGLIDIAQPMFVMIAMTAIFLAVGAGLFKWSPE